MGVIKLQSQPVRELTEKDFERMRIGAKHWDARLEEIPEGAKHRLVMERYISELKENYERGWGLVFWGSEYGIGKTSCLVILQKEFARRNGTSLFIRADQIVSILYGDDEYFDDDETWLDRALDVHLLAIDDLGQEPDSEGSARAVERLIRLRDDLRRPTCISANLTPKQIAERYPALASLLRGCALPVRVIGKQWRDAAQKEMREKLEGGGQ